MKEYGNVVETGNNSKHGENRCPQCGASDVTYNINKKKLVCNYCFTEFDAEDVIGIEKNIENLNEEIRGSGTKDIDNNADDIVTLKCGGCGAEVVINTKEAVNARCHWCRSILSINSQIDNGVVPDVVLPFIIDRKKAEDKIKSFVDKNIFFAHPDFKRDFSTNNIMGVYFPYILVDANCHGFFQGKAGKIARKYRYEKGKTRSTDEYHKNLYDIDVYDIEREFDILIDDLSIESNLDILDKNNRTKTAYIINSIMPFDTNNCVKFNSNYLVGFSLEKRNVNVGDLEEKVDKELKDITRFSLNKDLFDYNSGIKWEKEDLDIKGKQWLSAFLPVWLYSYHDSDNVLHYIAVNGRNGNIKGSIPINKKKIFFISLLIDFILFIIIYFFTHSIHHPLKYCFYFFLLLGPGYYKVNTEFNSFFKEKFRYRYEIKTKTNLTYLKKIDKKITTIKENDSCFLPEVNNRNLEGESLNITNIN